MIGITGGTVTWDWQISKFFACVGNATFTVDNIEALKAVVDLEPDQELDLLAYKQKCEDNGL